MCRRHRSHNLLKAANRNRGGGEEVVEEENDRRMMNVICPGVSNTYRCQTSFDPYCKPQPTRPSP